MMRYLLSLLFIFSLNVFAVPISDVYSSTSQCGSDGYIYVTNGWTGNNTTDLRSSNCSQGVFYSYGNLYVYHDFRANPNISGKCYVSYSLWQKTSETCQSTCSWATTPPYVQTNLNQSQCSNANKVGYTMDTTYTWNFSWCAVENTCYGLEYSCPAGQIFDSTTSSCRAPKEPFNPSCGTCGFYKQSGSIEGPAGKTCYIDYICKCNPKIRIRTDVSCSSGPVSDVPVTNPDAPNSPYEGDPTSAAPNIKDHSAMCGTEKMMAQASCVSPKILSFSCDPLTGTVTKSECKDPTTPATTPINSGDDTKAATTQDIKDLGNNLPTSIKDAIKDFFTDGSMPHLESIRGSLEAALTLDSDRNDKLDAISSSVDASLSLQSDANDHLSGIKTSVDGLKSSLDSGKTDQPFSGFTDNNIFQNPNDASNTSVLEDIKNFSNQIVTDATSIGTQFDNAKSSIQNGFQPVSLPSGGCSDLSFDLPGSNVQNVVPLSRVPSIISPYSPIFSLLVYMTVMFFIFKFLFLFFISRSK